VEHSNRHSLKVKYPSEIWWAAKPPKEIHGVPSKRCKVGLACDCWIAPTKQASNSGCGIGLETGASPVEILVVKQLVVALTSGKLLFRVDRSVN
jgi:hypothetical protein